MLNNKYIIVIMLSFGLMFFIGSSLFAYDGYFCVESKSGWVYADGSTNPKGVNLSYLFEDKIWSIPTKSDLLGTASKKFGFIVGIDIQKFSSDALSRGGGYNNYYEYNLGKITLNPILFMYGLNARPGQGVGWGWNIHIGLGVSLNKLERGGEFINLEKENKVKYTSDVNNSFAASIGIGADYYFYKNFSVTFDSRILYIPPRTVSEITYSDGSDVDINQSGYLQLLCGLKYLF